MQNKLKFQRNSINAKPRPRALGRAAPCTVCGWWVGLNQNKTFRQIVIPNTVRKMHPKDK